MCAVWKVVEMVDVELCTEEANMEDDFGAEVEIWEVEVVFVLEIGFREEFLRVEVELKVGIEGWVLVLVVVTMVAEGPLVGEGTPPVELGRGTKTEPPETSRDGIVNVPRDNDNTVAAVGNAGSVASATVWPALFSITTSSMDCTTTDFAACRGRTGSAWSCIWPRSDVDTLESLGVDWPSPAKPGLSLLSPRGGIMILRLNDMKSIMTGLRWP